MSEGLAARAYRDPWYAKNRDRVIERQHKRYADSIQHLTPEELAECRRDPRKVWTIRGPNLIACLECGELHEQLGHHLRVRHNFTAAAYKAMPGLDGKTRRFSKNASLLCLELQEQLSKKRKELKLGQRLQKSGKVPPVAKLIAARGSRQLSVQYRLEQGERKRGKIRPELRGRRLPPRPHRQKVSDSRILEILSLNLTLSEGAKRAGLSLHAFHDRARKLGWSAESINEQRRTVNGYVFELRRWIREQTMVPGIEQIIQRHTNELRYGAQSLFRDFTPFLPSMEAVLRANPGVIGKLVDAGPVGSAGVIALASRIFKRARLPRGSVARASEPRKSADQRENYKLAKAVHDLLARCREGLRIMSVAKAQWPTSRTKWESALRQAGFTAQPDIDTLISSRTAAAAAAKIVATKKGLTVRGVQNAYSACKKFLS